MGTPQESISEIVNEFIQTRASSLLFPIRITHELGGILTKHQHYHARNTLLGYTESNPGGHLGDFFSKAEHAARDYYPTLEEHQTQVFDTKRKEQKHQDEQGYNEYIAAYIHNVPTEIRARDMQMASILPRIVGAFDILADEEAGTKNYIEAYGILKDNPKFFEQYGKWIEGYFDQLKSQAPFIADVLADQNQFEKIQKKYEIVLTKLKEEVAKIDPQTHDDSWKASIVPKDTKRGLI